MFLGILLLLLCGFSANSQEYFLLKSTLGLKDFTKTIPSSCLIDEKDNFTNQALDRLAKLRSQLSYNDEYFSRQFAFGSDGTHLPVGLDMNILPIHKAGFLGKSVLVYSIDDGCQLDHVDFGDNVIKDLIENFTDDPNPEGTHGTATVGLILAKPKNSICIAGVSPEVSLGSLKLVGNGIYVSEMAAALMRDHQKVSIYSNSWGPLDDGKTVQYFKDIVITAIEEGIIKGRSGLGSIYLFSNGNGGFIDTCGADGYAAIPYAMAVQSVEESGETPKYAEMCGHIFISAFSSSTNSPTTDVNNGCRESFVGTSHANPLVTGCIALVLEANPNSSWRDIQHIISRSGKLTQSTNRIWQANAAGLLTSTSMGFGILDCARSVRLAQNWNNVGPVCVIQTELFGKQRPASWTDGSVYNDGFKTQSELAEFKDLLLSYESTVTIQPATTSQFDTEFKQNGSILFGTEICSGSIVESVLIEIDFLHVCRGALTVILISPSQTVSILYTERILDSYSGKFTMKLKSVQFMGENLYGKWTVKIIDGGTCYNKLESINEGIRGIVLRAKLTAHVTSVEDSAYTKNKKILDEIMTTVGKMALQDSRATILDTKQISNSYEELMLLSQKETVQEKPK